jgi:hypothetical protein
MHIAEGQNHHNCGKTAKNDSTSNGDTMDFRILPMIRNTKEPSHIPEKRMPAQRKMVGKISISNLAMKELNFEPHTDFLSSLRHMTTD